MREFEGHLAKAINRLDGVRGAVFERRLTEILDEHSFVRRMAYALCNPLEANLVRRRHEWTGLCLGGQEGTIPTNLSYFNEPRFRRAVRDADRWLNNFTRRKRRPLCFAATPGARCAYLQHVRAFAVAFRAASQAFRAGQLHPTFPRYSFRPSGPSG